MAVSQTVAGYLTGLPLFQGLTNKEVSLLASLMHERIFGDGEIIFDQGTPSGALCLSSDETITRGQELTLKLTSNNGEECRGRLPYGSVLSSSEPTEARMDKKPENYYPVFAPGAPNVRVLSERLTEAEAERRSRELMANPAATARIEKRMKRGGKGKRG